MATEWPLDSANTRNLEARLADIQRLGNELQHTQHGSPDYSDLQGVARNKGDSVAQH